MVRKLNGMPASNVPHPVTEEQIEESLENLDQLLALQ